MIAQNTLATDVPRMVPPDAIGIESLVNCVWGRQATDWTLSVMWGIARKYRNGVFGEIGTRSGVSTTMFALAARDVDGRVYTMDISALNHEEAVHNVSLSGAQDRVTFLRGDSGKTDFPEPLDVLFIDGDHSYEGVKADFERHASNVKPGGVIFFHDPCSCEGIGRYLKEQGIFYLPIEAGLGIHYVMGRP